MQPVSFSPLIVGSKVVTEKNSGGCPERNQTFSPLIVGSKVVTRTSAPKIAREYYGSGAAIKAIDMTAADTATQSRSLTKPHQLAHRSIKIKPKAILMQQQLLALMKP